MKKTILSLLGTLATTSLLAGPLKISTGGLEESFRYAPLEFEIRGVPDTADVALKHIPSGKEVPVQVVERTSRGLRIAWLAPSLEKGRETLWEMDLVPKGKKTSKPRVQVKKAESHAISVSIDGKEFTRLLSAPDQYKPYFFPVIGPNGKMITRQYPMKVGVEGEAQDHKHHRSLWFNHGKVGGADFWAEGQGRGRIRQAEVKSLESGPVFGRIVTRNEWIAPGDEKILDDSRVYTVYPLPKGEVLLDVSITLKPSGKAVLFGDTKEGSFGIRLAETMKEQRGGTIINSRGQKGMREAWGKPAEWVDYYGPVGTDTVGVAIFDHPDSFRHPTTWHVRNYGLFAANPFGYRDFKHGNRDGDYTLEQGKTLELRYCLYFHNGTTEDAKIADVYRGFASPPSLHPKE